MKRLFLNRKVSAKRRLRLFDVTLGGGVLWCAESRKHRVEEMKKLRSAPNAIYGGKHEATLDPVENGEGNLEWIASIS